MSLNYTKLFIKAICITFIVWLIPLILNKYPDTSFPFIIEEDIINSLVELKKNDHRDLELCPIPSPLNIGLINNVYETLNFDKIKNESLFARNYNIKLGGVWEPFLCTARFQVFLIIPFRNRLEHLESFLLYMHPFLQRQQISYRIVVVEQGNDKPFNRGKLFNIGFNEMKLLSVEKTCFIFHDIDLLPQNDHNTYACTNSPRHMSVAVDTFRYFLLYRELFGGAISIFGDQFLLLNGFSNSFDGWGGEDDNLASRMSAVGLTIVRFDPMVSMYTMLPHKKEPPSDSRFDILRHDSEQDHSEGLSTLHYQVKETQWKSLFTHIVVTW